MTDQNILEAAQEHFDAGRLDEAERVCRQILEQHPESTGALFQLALVHQERNEPLHAIAAYVRLVSINSNIPEAYYNLGVLLHAQHDYTAAAACHHRVVELKPDWPDGHNNLGIALLESRDLQGAADCFRQAIQRDRRHRQAWMNLGSALIKGAAPQPDEDAVTICRMAAELNPRSGQAHYNLGIVLEIAGQTDASLQSMRQAVELRPDQQMWKYYLDFKEGRDLPATAPVAYVTELFDAYAERFDEHLVGRLAYKTPVHLFEEFSACTEESELDILDLGCGTGLCAEAFRPRTRSMVGIDLSPRMIDVARGKGLYQELIVGELNAVMATLQTPFDAVLAADVFIYVGDLNDTFAHVYRVLRPGGWFVFSVEKCSGEGFILEPTRRFAHSLPYLRKLTESHGFIEARQTTRPQRNQAGTPIEGYVLVLRKPE